MKTAAFLSALLISLTACVPSVWVKPDGTAQSFEQDKQKCPYDVQLHNPDPVMWPMVVSQCLRAKGWSPQR